VVPAADRVPAAEDHAPGSDARAARGGRTRAASAWTTRARPRSGGPRMRST
jgi:hypothetical protein